MENSLTYTIFLSTLSLRRATPRICFRCSSVSISIHAPDRPAGLRTIDFYPRSPCGERLGDSGTSRAGETFLSTLSLRRATVSAVYADLADRISIHALLAESDSAISAILSAAAYFYPRSPCGERRGVFWPEHRAAQNFYPRSPCGERPQSYITDTYNLLFLSTLSLRRATLPVLSALFAFTYFYPRSPCGERLLL